MIRIAVIGAGAWGLNHVRVVASEAGSALAAVVDPDPAAIAKVRDLVGGDLDILTTADPDQVLSDPRIDAVVIASPAVTHAALAIRALQAGKHVLVEKPLAMNVRDARAVANAAAVSHRVAMVGHLMVYHPGVSKLREILHSGTLGHLHYLHSTRVNLGKLRRDENALWSFGPHDLSMIDYLLERTPLTVAARGQRVLQQDVEDVVFMTMRFATGEMAHVHLSWLNPRKERRLTLVCSQKMVEFDDVAADKLRIYDKGYDRVPEFTEYAQYLTLRDGDVHLPQLPMKEPLRVQMRDFVECIRTGRTPVANLDSAIRVIATLETAQASLAMDGVPLPVVP